MVSLVNSARLAKGWSSLGWINRELYANFTHLNFTMDVTSGNNLCAGGSTNAVCCTQGFYTAKGWDPVTGFGAVDFSSFYDYFTTVHDYSSVLSTNSGHSYFHGGYSLFNLHTTATVLLSVLLAFVIA
jgi:hypothetical protein